MKDLPDTDTRIFDQQTIDRYRRDGFVVVEDVFTGDALASLRGAVEAAVAAETVVKDAGDKSSYERIFDQFVNIWNRHPDVAAHTLSPRIGQMAAELEGHPMRIWHDQALFKQPGLGDNRTPWHQDSVYWPFVDRWRQTTIWIALEDATEENGCMSFIPGTNGLGPLASVDLSDPQSIFEQNPRLRDGDAVACPLRAGSVTFHNGFTWHYAATNRSDRVRKAYAAIFMPDGTIYDGQPHVVTDGLGLTPGKPLEGDLFPRVG